MTNINKHGKIHYQNNILNGGLIMWGYVCDIIKLESTEQLNDMLKCDILDGEVTTSLK